MNGLLEKLTSYNLFNYLLPGTLFSLLADEFTSYTFIHEDLFVAFFAYYFTGMVISRLGSLTLEPLLRKLGFVEFAKYREFLESSRADGKLELLSEVNNTYRTIATLFLCLAGVELFERLTIGLSGGEWLASAALFLGLFVLFLFSYRKQTKFIKERVENRGD